MPSFPLTLGFPWLGPLGILPLPVKYRIYFGDAAALRGQPDRGGRRGPGARWTRCATAIHGLLQRGRDERKGIFRG